MKRSSKETANTGSHRISIPKTLKSIDQLKSEGKYCPEEIEIINNKISQEKDKHKIMLIAIETLVEKSKYYFRNYIPTQNKSFCVFQCKNCFKIFTINISKKDSSVIILSEEFSKEHMNEAPVEKKGCQTLYYKACKELSLVPQWKEFTNNLILEKKEYLSGYREKYEKEPIYSLIQYVISIDFANTDVLYNIEHTRFLENKENCMYLITYITKFSIIFPTCKNIHLLCNIVSIDGTFHHERKCVSIYLTTVDQFGQIILLGASFGTTENSEIIEELLTKFKVYLLQYNHNIDDIRFFSDRGEAIIKSLNTVFPNNNHYYCSLHLCNNLITYLINKGINFKKSQSNIKTLNSYLHELCLICDESIFIDKFKEIIIFIYSQQYSTYSFDDIMKIDCDQCEEIESTDKETSIDSMNKRIKYYNDIIFYTSTYLFKLIQSSKYFSICMKEDEFRLGKTSNQTSESFNHSISETKDYPLVHHLYCLLSKEQEVCEERRMKDISKIKTNVTEEKDNQLNQLKILKESNLFTVVNRKNKHLLQCHLKSNGYTIATVEFRKSENVEKGICYCSCGIPQNLHIECAHMKFIKIKRQCYEWGGFELLDPYTSFENYFNYYESIEIRIPTIPKGFITTIERIQMDEKKIETDLLKSGSKEGKIGKEDIRSFTTNEYDSFKTNKTELFESKELEDIKREYSLLKKEEIEDKKSLKNKSIKDPQKIIELINNKLLLSEYQFGKKMKGKKQFVIEKIESDEYMKKVLEMKNEKKRKEQNDKEETSLKDEKNESDIEDNAIIDKVVKRNKIQPKIEKRKQSDEVKCQTKLINKIPGEIDETILKKYTEDIKEWIDKSIDFKKEAKNFIKKIQSHYMHTFKSYIKEIYLNGLPYSCIPSTYFYWFISFLENTAKKKSVNINIVTSVNESIEEIESTIKMIDNWDIILYTQFMNPVELGHWILNILDKKQIQFIFLIHYQM